MTREKTLYGTVLIVGGGLIGTSVARAAMKAHVADKIVITDQDKNVRARLRELNMCHEVCDEPSVHTSKADLIILAVPPGAMADAVSGFVHVLTPKTLLSDVGSIKGKITEEIKAILPDGVEFIGGHPIAGTEQSGPDAGFAELFEHRWCILTPDDETTPSAQKLKQFWQAFGSEVTFMDCARHDLVLATTSHLPHLIAYALVGTAMDMETVTNKEVVKYSAAGFRDFTRIAASSPIMWRDVFLGNKEAVLEVLGRYIEDLTALKKSIRWSDGDTLLQEFTKTREIRTRIVDAGQDAAAPNFGRDQSKNME
ncbi:MAG TPA: prephenate/arogenate dehydrogenase family protein [Hellea balneolensis]|uniref:prephenate dehydrogenase n=1 Tax=Hellea balneolensis TaxID=287478 RepID=A0A7C3C9Q6_9PROT|nr:prephenate/arogenate dehydrogenase family protein [Hellea balneolensis]